MKAVAITPHTTGMALIDAPEPVISAPDQVKLKVICVGICGTDRELHTGHIGDAPPGQNRLIIGHEMFGQVVEAGSAVTSVKVGDYGVFTVRRGCGHCNACNNGHSDMCESGDYKERGIKALNGYMTEYVVDSEVYLARVPTELADVGVLTEPLSVGEKAIDEAVALQVQRLPNAGSATTWLRGKRVLVAGLGPIGMLAALILADRGAQVIGLDVLDENTIKPQMLVKLGGTYIDGRKVSTDTLDDHLGQIDLIFEATGVSSLSFQLIDALGINGIYVMTGVPGGNRPVTIDGNALMQQIVLENQVVFGSVNANRTHFKMAIDDLSHFRAHYPEVLAGIITNRFTMAQAETGFDLQDPNAIKSVVEIAD